MIGGELLGEIRRHFRRCQILQPVQILSTESVLNLDETLFEHRKISRGQFELRAARLEAGKSAARARSRANTLAKPSVKASILERKSLAPDEGHDQLENQIQK